MSRYTATTEEDRRAMLQTIGVDTVEELFDRQIPADVRLVGGLDLPPGRSEQDVYEHLRDLASRNVSTEDEVCFMGAGMYDHYVPALVDMLTERSEFLTPYTPYQPEISQGGLQVMFEYQTAICELTGLDVSNASVYDGASAVAAAAYLAKLDNHRSRLVISAAMHPHTVQTLRTYAHGYGMEVVEVGEVDGATDVDAWRRAIDRDTAAVFFSQPSFYGVVEDATALSAAAGEGPQRPVVVAQVDPLTLGILAPPGQYGADVAVGEGQSLGNHLDFGGPSFGFFAAREPYLRRMPGRIAGETRDVEGQRGFVLTLQTREQHIRRERATSNICTAQALNALAGVVYLSWLGRSGIVELGELMLSRTDYARRLLGSLEGVHVAHSGSVVREFALRLEDPDDGGLLDVGAVRRRCIAEGINPGVDLHRMTGRDQDRGGLLVAITERRSRAQIDRLREVLGAAIDGEIREGGG